MVKVRETKPERKLKEEMLKGMDLLKHGRDGKEGERNLGEGKEKEGSLETGLQRRRASWNEQSKTELGKGTDRQQIGADRQMGKEAIMTKTRGKPSWREADKRCWRRATEGKEKTGR